MKLVLLFLTCADEKEADKIAFTLLQKRLIVCAKKIHIASSSLWKGSIEQSQEILLMMETMDSLFAKIEKEVRKIHSYETFVLLSLPVNKVSEGIEKWMKIELRTG